MQVATGNRPYIEMYTKDLIQFVDQIKDDKNALVALKYEISFRKKAAQKLASTVAKADRYIELLEHRTSTLKDSKVEPTSNALMLRAKAREEAREAASGKTPDALMLRAKAREEAREAASGKTRASEEAPDVLQNNRTAKKAVKTAFAGQESFAPHSSTRGRPSSELEYYPTVVGKLFGFEFFLAQFDLNSKTISINSSKAPLSLTAENCEWKWSKCAFGYTLNIRSKEAAYNIKIPKRFVKKFDRFFCEHLFYPDATRALNEFDHILKDDTYLNNRKVKAWHQKYQKVITVTKRVGSVNGVFDSLRELLDAAQELISKKNDRFVQSAVNKWGSYLSTVEKNPLTSQQMKAIVTEDDACLVVAGAGTGKTSTVVGKIGYLISSRISTPDKILALAFGRDAAAEMRERVKDRLDVEVEIRTFHSLGLAILKEHQGHKLRISESATQDRTFLALVANLLRQVASTKKGGALFTEFISQHRMPAKYLEDFDNNGEYLKYLRKVEPITLKGEQVKSFEELLIADWLCLNGIQYEYEYPYEHKTASMQRNQYRPDFYLSDYGIYLEHFGIDKKGRTRKDIDAKKYNEGIKWKREQHKKFGTLLVETYSWERMEGHILDTLASKLKTLNVRISPFDVDAIFELIETSKIRGDVVSLLKDFLAVFKENQFEFFELKQSLQEIPRSEVRRYECFLNLFELLHKEYEEHLFSRQEIDFADLIKNATALIENGHYDVCFDRIIVDEYQDISRGRFKFLSALINAGKDVRLLAVGDDWQSIYGFTGSDVTRTTGFESLFDKPKIIPLDQTFRFNKHIQNLSSAFIQKNPDQLTKEIKAKASKVKEPITLQVSAGKPLERLNEALDLIYKKRPRGERWQVYLLGRYNFCKPKNLDSLNEKYKMLDISFKTIHSSKGLEADAVVVLELVGGRYGFPSLVESDPIMSLVVPAENTFQYAEERRVLYVAMTRAKEVLVLSVDSSNPSEFVPELIKELGNGQGRGIVERMICPMCCTGELINKFPRREKGYAWVCSLSPYCDGKYKYCEECLESPSLPNQQCSSTKCKKNRGVK